MPTLTALAATVALALGIALHETQGRVDRLEQSNRHHGRQIVQLVGVAELQQNLIHKDVGLIDTVVSNQEQILALVTRPAGKHVTRRELARVRSR